MQYSFVVFIKCILCELSCIYFEVMFGKSFRIDYSLSSFNDEIVVKNEFLKIF